jgi:hypothetical protein
MQEIKLAVENLLQGEKPQDPFLSEFTLKDLQLVESKALLFVQHLIAKVQAGIPLKGFVGVR